MNKSRWHLALVQHPMYYLIQEDTGCAERTPPWGAANIDVYIERIRDNLATLRKFKRDGPSWRLFRPANLPRAKQKARCIRRLGP